MKYSLIVSAVLFGSLTGCMSMQNQSTLDAISGASGPYVEAYIEYPGPHEKWAGPVSFLMHITARDAGIAQVGISPALYTAKNPAKGATVSNRTPASGITTVTQAQIQGFTGEIAREKLTKLAAAMQGAEQPFRGCLYPIRVRMIRADGAVTDRNGCRGQGGWTRMVSETASEFISASVYGVAPAPAAVPVAPAPGGAKDTAGKTVTMKN